MSWLSVAEHKVADTVGDAFAGLVDNPAIQNNPDALKAVSDAKATVAAAATTVTTAVQVAGGQLVAASSPILQDLEGALETGVGTALTAAFGEPGALAAEPVDLGIELLFAWAHSKLDAMQSTAQAAKAAATAGS